MLDTSINIDFQAAIDSISKFNQKLDSITNVMKAINNESYNLSHTTVNKLLQKELKSLDASNFEIDVNLKETLEKKLATTVAKFVANNLDVQLNEGSNFKIGVTLNESQMDKISSKISKSVADNLDLTSFDKTKVKINKKTADLIKKKINDKIQAELDTTPVDFTVPKGQKSPLLTVDLDETKLKSISDNISEQIMKFYSSADGIKLSGLEPIEIDNEVLKTSLIKLKESLENAGKYLHFDDSLLDEIPKLQKVFAEHQGKIGGLVKDTVEIVKAIDNLSSNDKKDAELLGKFKTNLKGIRTSLLGIVGKLSEDMLEATRDSQLGTLKEAEVKAKFEQVNTAINKHLLSSLNVVEHVSNALSEKPMSPEMLTNVADRVRPIIQAVTTSVMNNIAMSIPQLLDDKTVFSEAIGEFKSKYNESIKDKLISQAVSLNKAIVNNQDEIIKGVTSSISESIAKNVQYVGGGEVEPIKITVPINSIVKKVEDFATEVSKKAVESAIVVSSASVNLESELISKLDSRVNTKSLLGTLKSQGKDITALPDLLNEKAKTAKKNKDLYVESAQKASNILGTSGGMKNLGAELNKMISDFIKVQSTSIMREYSGALSSKSKTDTTSIKATVDTGKAKIVSAIDSYVSGLVSSTVGGFGSEKATALGAELKSLESTVDVIVDSYIKTIKSIAEQRLAVSLTSGDSSKITVELPRTLIDSKIKKSATTHAKELLKDMEVKFSGKEAKSGSYFTGEISKAVDASIKGFINSRVDSVVSEVGRALSIPYDSASLASVNAEIKVMSENITTALVRQAKLTADALLLNITTLDYSAMSAKEKKQVEKIMQQSMSTLLQEYVKSLTKAVQTLYNTANVHGEAVGSIKKQLAEAMKTAKVDGDGNVDLTAAYLVALKRVTDATIKSVSTWTLSGSDTTGAEFKKLISPAIAKMIDNFGKSVATDISSYMSQEGSGNARYFVKQLNRVTDTFFKNYTNSILKSYNAVGVADFSGTMGFKTSRLNGEIKKSLARKFNVTVEELVKSIPEFKGEDMQMVLNQMFTTIFEKFNEAVGDNLMSSVKIYKDEMKKIEIKPDMSPMDVLINNMTEFQQEVVRKAKQMLNLQFKSLVSEVRGLKIVPTNLAVESIANPSVVAAETALSTKMATIDSRLESVRKSKSAVSQESKELMLTDLPSVSQYSDAMLGSVSDRKQRRGFTNSVVNTLRYIVAGHLIGQPIFTNLSEGWTSYKEVDYQMEKARQNILAKYRGGDAAGMKPFQDFAEQEAQYRYENRDKLGMNGISSEIYMDEDKKKQAVERIRQDIADIMENGIIKPLQDMAIYYGISQKDMATVWQIATRSQDNPFDSFAMASAASKIYSTEREEIDPVQAAMGFEALTSQWGLKPSEKTSTGERVADKYSNMLIKSSLMSQASSKDLLDAMGRSGSVFSEFLGDDMTKDRRFATALAYQSMFVQATGRPGTEAGTFWRNVMTVPFRKETSDYLRQVSNSSDPTIAKVNPYNITYSKDGVPNYEQKPFHQIFTDIINASLRMRELGNDREANALLSSIFKSRTFGYEQGIEALLEKMFGKLDEMGIKNFEQYIDKIANVSQAEIDEYIGGLSSSTEFRSQQVQSMFQATSYEVLEGLKPEFSQLMDSLIGMLRTVKDNADAISTVLSMSAKVLLTLGAYKALQFGGGKVKDHVLTSEFESKAAPFMYDRNALLRGRHIESEKYLAEKDRAIGLLGSKSSLYSGLEKETIAEAEAEVNFSALDTQYQEALKRRQERDRLSKLRAGHVRALESGNLPEERRTTLTGEIQQLDYKIGELSKSPFMDDSQFKNLTEDRNRAKSAYHNAKMKLSDYEGNIGGVDKQQREAITKAALSKQEVARMDGLIAESTQQIDRLSKVFVSLGASSELVESSMHKLDIEMKNKAFMDNKTLTNTDRFTKELKTLNRELDDGYISSKRYAEKLNALNGQKSVGGKVADASGLGGVLTGAGMGNMMSKVGTFAKGAGLLALASFGLDIADDIFSGLMTTTGEQKRQSYDKTKGYLDKYYELYQPAVKQHDEAYLDIYGSGNMLKELTLFGEQLKSGIVNAFTGNGISFSDSAKINEMVREGKTRTEIADSIGLNKKKAEADRAIGEQQRAENEMSVYSRMMSLDGSESTEAAKELSVGSYESISEFLDRLQQDESLFSARSSNLLQVSQTELKYAGFRESSDEMTNLLKDFLDSNIETLRNSNSAIESIMMQMVEARGVIATSEPAYKALEQKKLENEKSIAEMREKLLQAEAAKITEIQNTFDLAFAELSAKSSQSVVGLISQGYRKDSEEVVSMQLKEVQERLNLLKDENGQLRVELNSKKLEPEKQDELRTKIYANDQQIAQLETQLIESPTMLSQAISNQYSRYKGLSSSGYSIQKSLLEMRGYTEESPAYKAVQRLELQEQNSLIAQEVTKLKQKMNGTDNKGEQENILIQIRNLEAQSVQNLAAIYKLQKQSAWGLPAGIKPMTNYEYEAKKNTQRSATVQQGNITVNVKFDNVYAKSKEEIERGIIDPIKEAVESANRSMVNSLNRQISRK